MRFIDKDGAAGRSDSYDEGLAFLRSDVPLWLALFRRNVMMTTSNLLARRDVALAFGGFGAYRYCHDIDFMLRAIFGGWKLRFLDATLCDYRMHPANTIAESALRLSVEEAFLLAKLIAADRVRLSAAHWRFSTPLCRKKRLAASSLPCWGGRTCAIAISTTARSIKTRNSKPYIRTAAERPDASADELAAAIRGAAAEPERRYA